MRNKSKTCRDCQRPTATDTRLLCNACFQKAKRGPNAALTDEQMLGMIDGSTTTQIAEKSGLSLSCVHGRLRAMESCGKIRSTGLAHRGAPVRWFVTGAEVLP